MCKETNAAGDNQQYNGGDGVKEDEQSGEANGEAINGPKKETNKY